MSKLYICNTTRQRWHHSFRVPEMKRLYYVRIPAGSQVEVDHNLGEAAHKAIISQLERYGGRDAASVNGKLEKFPGLFYKFDRPIPVDDIVAGHDAVLDHAERRSAGAVAASAMAIDAIQRDKTGQRLSSVTEVEVTEEVKPGNKPTGKEIKSKFIVSPDGSDSVKLPEVV
ncbi:hypothetical protein [Dyella caseinilytica]|uniref:Uncharacterized protein n=1 Tax=Dyella caseinilytica TaxID=1849581 RepID=A0ABX7H1F7_9GAMM|nr:hypothetical protein [Dyella caseinilytica]QRN55250.1 hypothetical protein ISN74_07945 [Dyella caseinilytica]GGA00414.1 hypothetical protein GCM10011408_21680 [Dyella caseinilytica]